ncbi:hypothetical protein [Leucobacter chromiireducens]|uniref:Colicin transporter n=1 Tax=Leucobacter chromiireducens subsp. chromiireducens TaxID=660067 RepID=A0ABS1ST54_9MICO|nr:hypothetical protein [Leucobacter chromiireducens]MBL3690362.1 hypothetical protein [Leucobacter chromiireducens subsp. chromiireducens]
MSQPTEAPTKQPWYRRKQIVIPVAAGTALVFAAGGALIGFQAAYGSLKQNQNYAITALEFAQAEAVELAGTAEELSGKTLTTYEKNLEVIAGAPALVGKTEAKAVTDARETLGKIEVGSGIEIATGFKPVSTDFEWVTPGRYSEAAGALDAANQMRATAESGRDAQAKLVDLSAEQIVGTAGALGDAAKNAVKNTAAVQKSSDKAAKDAKETTAKAVERVERASKELGAAKEPVAEAKATLELGAATAALVDAQAKLAASHKAEVAKAEAAAAAAAAAAEAAAPPAPAPVEEWAPAPYTGGEVAQDWGGGGGGGGWNAPAPDPTPAPVAPPSGGGGGGGSWTPPPPPPGGGGCPAGMNCNV